MLQLNRRNPLYGIGINDSDEPSCIKGWADGKYKIVWRCPVYSKWKGMLTRCFSEDYHSKFPCSKDNTVVEPWLTFSNFKEWADTQIWTSDLHLDKDILVRGNREYGPNTCSFIPGYINTLLTTHATAKRKYNYPIGAVWIKENQNFSARCKINGKLVHLLTTDDPMEAHKAWQNAKAGEIESIVNKYSLEACYREDVALSLLKVATSLRENAENGIQTFHL